MVDGVDVVAEVHAVLDRMAAFAEAVRSGDWTGHTGKRDQEHRQHRHRRLRPRPGDGVRGAALLQPTALLTLRFVSNVDGTDFAEATRDLDAAETLFIVCSKTFTTLETMTNAHAARDWCVARLGDEKAVAKHFVAVSTNAEGVQKFGIDAAEHVRLLGLGRRPLLDGLGDRPVDDDRRSGPKNFRAMLAGFHAMDEHFRSAPFEQNMPVLLGLLAIWNNDFLGAATQAVLPYEQYLKRFPAYLQQLTMESNGKHVTPGRRSRSTSRRRRSSGASRAPTASIRSTS